MGGFATFILGLYSFFMYPILNCLKNKAIKKKILQEETIKEEEILLLNREDEYIDSYFTNSFSSERILRF